ncbi:MAG: folylpolyglutamate synthase/dihydrofolate synthase family protein [Legionellales bacterium]|jgi:dihydrofolate synthase/folylpolyglutamate synthase
MLPNNLPEWLDLLEQTNPLYIDLSLTRMQQAVAALDLISLNAPVITVGGTNGKGSTVCAIENIYRAAGYKTASTISPHLFKFNERVKLNTESVDDETLCAAFAAVYATSQKFNLTYFEIITLAAFWIFKQTKLDIIILEVGLGGRMDAVNVIEPNVAVITNVDLDHTDRLGSTREAIAKEKAGIFRKNIPIVCGDQNPPKILKETADNQGAQFIQSEYFDLPTNDLLPENMRTAVTAVMQLQNILPVSKEQIEQGLKQCKLPGRQQVIFNKCKQIFDVAHNPAGLKKLAQRLHIERQSGKILLVISMFKDKDLLNGFNEIKNCVDEWYVAPINSPRAASLEQLKSVLDELEIKHVHYAKDLPTAYSEAIYAANTQDTLVVAGSFYTVAELFKA